ncbi:enoyl-CoA hydratase/isomerase family protein [Chloroflexota bacterium]
MGSDQLLVEVEDKIARLTLNRPEVLNALSHELKSSLAAALTQANSNPDVRVVVLQGAGDRAFSAGQDLSETRDLDEEGARHWIDGYDRLYSAIREMDKIVIAKINGYAVGAGFQLTLLSDLRIASDSAKVGMTEVNAGLPCITGTGLLWPIAGEADARRLVLTGDLVDAIEAKAMGLVHEVVAKGELSDRVDELASRLTEKAPGAIKLTKEWCRMQGEDNYRRTIQHALEAHASAYGSGEPAEYMSRFLKKKRD